MATLNMMSWNVYGGDTQSLADAIKGTHPKGNVDLGLDLVVLEEAQNQATATFYNPLKLLAGYSIDGPYKENFTMIKLSGGQNIYAAQGVNRSYSILSKTANITINSVGLVNLVNDPYVLAPNDAIRAAQVGLNQRPPLAIDLTHKTGVANNKITVFAWHAPVAPFTDQVLKLFDGSKALADAETTNGNRVIIAGDLNTKDVTKVFNKFDGLQDKFDYILTNFGTVKDLRKVVAGSDKVLDALWGDAHPAVAGEITY